MKNVIHVCLVGILLVFYMAVTTNALEKHFGYPTFNPTHHKILETTQYYDGEGGYIDVVTKWQDVKSGVIYTKQPNPVLILNFFIGLLVVWKLSNLIIKLFYFKQSPH